MIADISNIIIEMRAEGKSYTAISKVVGVDRNKISAFCNDNGCGVVLSDRAMRAARLKGEAKTKAKIQENTFTCKYCGVEYVRNPNRWGDGDCGTFFCSIKCGAQYRYKDHVPAVKNDKNLVYFVECNICGKMFTARSKAVSLCSDDCRVKYRGTYDYKRNKALHDATQENIQCPECGKLFYPGYGDKKRKFCSCKCGSKYHSKTEKGKQGKAKNRRSRRARKENAFVEDVCINVLFDRDLGRCQLCGKKLNKSRTVPHSMAITLDHIIPLSKGGEHSYKNSQLACFHCNSVKGDRVWKSGEQLLMFG